MRNIIGVLGMAMLLGATACDDALDVDPDVAEVAGIYEAKTGKGTLTVTPVAGGTSRDLLATGGSIQLTLAVDGTTTGRLLLPGEDEDGGDLDESLAGTWTLDDGVVDLAHAADTFLRDLDLVYANGALTGEETFGDQRVRVVIRR